jgi:hypothetical protein
VVIWVLWSCWFISIPWCVGATNRAKTGFI